MTANNLLAYSAHKIVLKRPSTCSFHLGLGLLCIM